MAHPRIFISSTFYDLRHVRNDLERFVTGLGYEPILNERGRIPYGPEDRLEDYCYKEIQNIDILVSIIGNRHGSRSQREPYSVSQMELKYARELGKQIYIFVEANVLSEYRVYQRNRDVKGFQCVYVDDPGIHKFIEEIEGLPSNNAMAPFESSQDITQFLTEQWAGLFQRFLQEQSRRKEIQLIRELQSTANTLDKLVTFLTEEKRNTSSAIQQILLNTHPAFAKLRTLVSCPYPVFFTDRTEMDAWLQARSYSQKFDPDGSEKWQTKPIKKTYQELEISDEIFDGDGKLKVFTSAEWRDEWISQHTVTVPEPEFGTASDDDVPF